MKGEERKWRQSMEIKGRCRKMNGNEGIWSQVKANGIK